MKENEENAGNQSIPRLAAAGNNKTNKNVSVDNNNQHISIHSFNENLNIEDKAEDPNNNSQEASKNFSHSNEIQNRLCLKDEIDLEHGNIPNENIQNSEYSSNRGLNRNIERNYQIESNSDNNNAQNIDNIDNNNAQIIDSIDNNNRNNDQNADINLEEKKNIQKQGTMKDLEELSIMDRLKYDNRTYCKYFLDQLCEEHIILNLIFKKSLLCPLNLRVIRVIGLVSMIFVMNAMLYSDEHIKKRSQMEEEKVYFCLIFSIQD